MDLTSISAAYTGLKFAKDVFSAVQEMKVETATLEKINAATKCVGEAQDTIFEMREMLIKLQDANLKLKAEIAALDQWNSRLSSFELTKTEGGAVVYKTISGLDYFVCPSCIENRQIHPLQDMHVMSGEFRCPSCKANFPIQKNKLVTKRDNRPNYVD